jgi:hypothetical protein
MVIHVVINLSSNGGSGKKKGEIVRTPVCWPSVCDLVHQPTTITNLVVSMLQLGVAPAHTADHFDASITIRPPLRAS